MSARVWHIEERILQVAKGRRAGAVADMQKVLVSVAKLRLVGQIGLTDDIALIEVAQDFGEGKLKRRSDDRRNDAIEALATTLNNMADVALVGRRFTRRCGAAGRGRAAGSARGAASMQARAAKSGD